MIRAAYVPPSHFYGHRWHRYLIPVRITLRLPDRPGIYRWLIWNFQWVTPKGQPPETPGIGSLRSAREHDASTDAGMESSP